MKAIEDWVVERQFRTAPGVVDVNGFGGPTKQYQVLIDPAKLKSYGITLNQVFTALSNGNRNAGGSYIEHGPELYIVRGLGFIESVEDIRNIAVDTRNGTPIRVRDIGAGANRRTPAIGAGGRVAARETGRGRRGGGHRHSAARRERAGSLASACARKQTTLMNAICRQACA